MMQKSSKFLISDLISDQPSLYAPRQLINEHDNSKNYLNVQNTAEFLVKSIDINKTQVNINDIIYNQLNEFFIKGKPVPQFSDKEPKIVLNEFNQGQRRVNETHAHNSFCNCISCQALRFFNLVNNNKDLNQFNNHEKNSTHNITSSNNFINDNQHSHTNNNTYYDKCLEENTLLNLSDAEPVNLKKRANEEEAYKKSIQNLDEPKALKKQINNILKGIFFNYFVG